MKRLFALLLALCVLLGTSAAVAETWVCQVCGATNEHNFCGDCGAKKTNEWVCSNCGATNTSKFCPDCGQSRDENGVAPVETPEPAPNVQESQVKYIPRVEFYRGESLAKIYVTTDNVFYAGDYAEDVHYHVALRAENPTDESYVINVKARIGENTYSFTEYTLEANDYHNFYVNTVSLEVGTYDVEWLINDQPVTSLTVTVKEGTSELYKWLQNNLDATAALCIWDTAEKTRVQNGISIGELSKLESGQKYIPHLALKNKSDAESPALYVAFLLDDDTWWWEDQVLESGKTNNYVHSSYEHKTGASELVLYVNGIQMAKTLFAILGE